MKEIPTIGDEYTYNGLPCWVIDVANDGAWFGVVQGIRRMDRNKGAFRRYDASDYPVKKEKAMPRTITEILKDADAATELQQLITLWNEIADDKNKRHYALTQIWFANEHIRGLSLKVKGSDFQKGTFYHALKEMYNPF